MPDKFHCYECGTLLHAAFCPACNPEMVKPLRMEYSLVDVFIFCLATWATVTLFNAFWPLHHPLFVGCVELVIASALFVWWRVKTFKITES